VSQIINRINSVIVKEKSRAGKGIGSARVAILRWSSQGKTSSSGRFERTCAGDRQQFLRVGLVHS
jgi:hypothetical protein